MPRMPWLLLLLASAALAAQSLQAIPPYAYGTFAKTFKVRSYSSECEEADKDQEDDECGLHDTTSTVIVSPASPGLAKVEVSLAADNGHNCFLEDTAVWENSHLVIRQQPASAEEGICVVSIKFGANRIEELDGQPWDACQRNCGARAVLSESGLVRVGNK